MHRYPTTSGMKMSLIQYVRSPAHREICEPRLTHHDAHDTTTGKTYANIHVKIHCDQDSIEGELQLRIAFNSSFRQNENVDRNTNRLLPAKPRYPNRAVVVFTDSLQLSIEHR